METAELALSDLAIWHRLMRMFRALLIIWHSQAVDLNPYSPGARRAALPAAEDAELPGLLRATPARRPGRPAARRRRCPYRLSQLLVTATQSISISNGPVHSGTQKKIRAGGFLGK
jgi:hypothetical protein